MIDTLEIWLNKLKKRLNEASPVFMDMGISWGMSLVFAMLVSAPFAFIRNLELGLIRFFPGVIMVCFALYRRGFRRSYFANSHTYSFSLRTCIVNIVTVVVFQSLIILFWRNHTLFITGPTFWIVKIIFPAARSTEIRGYILHEVYNWLLMLLAVCLLYGPALIYGEYVGSKKHIKDYQIEKQE